MFKAISRTLADASADDEDQGTTSWDSDDGTLDTLTLLALQVQGYVSKLMEKNLGADSDDEDSESD